MNIVDPADYDEILNPENDLKARLEHSIVIARTQEGTLLRRIDSLELETIPEEIPIGSYTWKEEFEELVFGLPGKQKVLKRRFTLDSDFLTVRHYDFSIPVRVGRNQGDIIRAGQTISTKYFKHIGATVDLTPLDVMFITPRELVEPQILHFFEPTILWFFKDDQKIEENGVQYMDSVPFSARRPLKDRISKISEYLPVPVDCRNVSATYALCSHRTDALTTWNGTTMIERNKKIEIGKWYSCQYNQSLGNKCTSIMPFNTTPPVDTFTQTYIDPVKKVERTLVLCRDIVPIPQLLTSVTMDNEYSTTHPLLYKIFFPLYCAFNQRVGVKVCFARQQYSPFEDNQWEPVAVENGLGQMYWLPQLPEALKNIIRKEAFPFIKTLTAAEAEHYDRFESGFSFDEINADRVKQFKNFQDVQYTGKLSTLVPEDDDAEEEEESNERKSHAVELF